MNLVNRITPFIIAGMIIVVLTFGIILLAYLFVFGAIVGAVMFLINWIRSAISKRSKDKQPASQSGRVIDSNDWRKL